MNEVFIISVIAAFSLTYYWLFQSSSRLKGIADRIRRGLEIENPSEASFSKQWFEHVFLGSCPYCLAGNLAVISCFVFPADAVIFFATRIGITILFVLIIQKVYESTRVQ